MSWLGMYDGRDDATLRKEINEDVFRGMFNNLCAVTGSLAV